MNTAFPFGLPGPSAFYLTLYVLTLVAHVVFMNYVLGGSAYLAFVSIFRGGAKQRHRSPAALVMRDWMPFALSAAITAGIAPLLFVQILYQERFYTANLLLFNRFMVILPVLIVAFYLLYVLKSRRIGRWPLALRTVVGIGAFASFLFVAWTWTENHLLSMQDQATWTAMFASGAIVYKSSETAPRLSLWFLGSLPTTAMLVTWQLRYYQLRATHVGMPAVAEARSPETAEAMQECMDPAAAGVEARRMCRFGLIALALTLCAGAWYWWVLPEQAQRAVLGALGFPYVVLAFVGLCLQVGGWVMQLRALGRGNALNAAWLWVGGAGMLLAILGATVLREVIRLSRLDIEALASTHARAREIGGLGAFLVFAVLNAALIALCVRLVRRSIGRAPTLR